jgi:type IV secretory pathway VirB2 component (pilin)
MAITANYRLIDRAYWTAELGGPRLRAYRVLAGHLEVAMFTSFPFTIRRKMSLGRNRLRSISGLSILLLFPALAYAQSGSPFDTGFTAIQTLFTGTIAKVASLVAIVIGGYGFAHGEPGAKKALAGVAAGTGIAVLAVNVLTWLWGV